VSVQIELGQNIRQVTVVRIEYNSLRSAQVLQWFKELVFGPLWQAQQPQLVKD
jgi:hypothetical protein